MFHPTRGGTRGGQGDFKWSDVAADKDREYYLGHSLRAPVGRWQNGKDLTWYNKEGGADAEARERERQEELKRIKEAEEDALAQALGFAPTPRQPTVPATPSVSASTSTDPNAAILEKARRKAEKRAEHEARKAERQRIREERAARHKHGRDERAGSARSAGGSERERRGEKERTRSRSRSRSPRRRTDYHDRDERDHRHRPARSRYDDRDPLGRSHDNRHDAYGAERRVRGGSAEREEADRHGSRTHRDDVRRDERYRSRESEERRVDESGPSSRPLRRDEERYAGARQGAERMGVHAASKLKREESSRSPPPSPRRRL